MGSERRLARAAPLPGLPGLAERGITDGQIDQMLVRNPRDFFAA
ncbi:MAG TPA: hypothetical protein VN695_06925 [Streptosporangiaceae bacterium]|nr:hypothetical protein [Streptosporangiaceae bacterium]